MPAKFKPTEKIRTRGSTKVVTKHYYLKTTPKEELITYINSSNAKPKIIQKCLNELTRRGLKVNWVEVGVL